MTGILSLGILAGGGMLSASEPVDVNKASARDLMCVPGMTQVWAARIVRFRPYRTKLDLLEKGVVSPEEYKRIRDGIVAHHVDH